jgi:stage V sporulation protein D (sporulation-specific penicillin-binding protein)
MALESVVANGSGRNAYIEGYRVGGKTGTAQKVSNGKYMVGNYILSFIGFLPANDPKVVVYVAIDNPKGVVQYGGTTVAPVAKAIMEDAITALGIEKQEGGLDKEYQWYDTKYERVTDVVGLTLKEAKNTLSSFQIEVEGEGSKVIAMSPSANSYVAVNSTIRLMLGN